MSNRYDDTHEMLDMTRQEYEDWIDEIVNEWQSAPDKYVCDCQNNYGKNCKYPNKYRSGGCK